VYYITSNRDVLNRYKEYPFKQSFLKDRVVSKNNLKEANNAVRKGLLIKITVSIVKGFTNHNLYNHTPLFA